MGNLLTPVTVTAMGDIAVIAAGFLASEKYSGSGEIRQGQGQRDSDVTEKTLSGRAIEAVPLCSL